MPADPAGIFTSDEHRRVLANCSGQTLAQVAAAVHADPNTQVWPQGPGDIQQVSAIVDDLTADGYLKKPDAEGRLEFSKKGLDALTGDAVYVPPPMDPARAAREIADFVARERASLDQQKEASLAAIDSAVSTAKSDLNDNIDSYSAVLDDLAASAPKDA